MSPITLDRFLTEDFFTLLGMEELPEEKKQLYLDMMSRTVLARVFQAISAELSAEERAELDQISSEEMVDYLQQKGFDVATLILNEAMRYRAEVTVAFSHATEAAASQ
jgi:VIT1/CCC1 family predicted Fe2+/Mn2+ transporter